MKTSSSLLLAFVLFACNSSTENKESLPAEVTTPAAASTQHCYQYASVSDTITLNIVVIGDSVTGRLVYKLKEKDKNDGTIKGRLKNDLLTADYTFMSEGTESVRPVAFKKQAGGFVEGYGDVSNAGSLDFSHSFPLSEVACD